MKTIFKILIIFVVFISCQKTKNSSSKTEIENKILGCWESVEAEVDGKPRELRNEFTLCFKENNLVHFESTNFNSEVSPYIVLSDTLYSGSKVYLIEKIDDKELVLYEFQNKIFDYKVYLKKVTKDKHK